MYRYTFKPAAVIWEILDLLFSYERTRGMTISVGSYATMHLSRSAVIQKHMATVFFPISMTETLFCSYIIRSLLYLPFLWGYLMVQLTLQWPFCVTHFLHWKPYSQFILWQPSTVMGVAPIWFMETLFSAELTYDGKLKHYIPLSGLGL